MKTMKWLAPVFALVMVAGCKSSFITSSWKAENISAKKYNKVLVLGLIHDNARDLQQQMEEHLAGDLRDMGYNTTTSLKEFGPRAFNKMSEKEALEELKNTEVDAVVTIVLLNKKTEREFITNKGQYLYGSYRNRFWDYYQTIDSRVYEPGYYVTNTHYYWESNFYDMSTQALIYSVQTQSFDPSSAEALGHEYGQMIVKDMEKNQVVQKQQISTIKSF